jgi:hypothetical protein
VPLLNTEVILSPEGASETKLHQLAPRRFNSLEGLRIGLLGNNKLNADAVLVAIADLLQERYKVGSVMLRTKPSFARPAPDEMIDEMLEECDVVLAGVGD